MFKKAHIFYSAPVRVFGKFSMPPQNLESKEYNPEFFFIGDKTSSFLKMSEILKHVLLFNKIPNRCFFHVLIIAR